jgi:hypothetical protein
MEEDVDGTIYAREDIADIASQQSVKDEAYKRIEHNAEGEFAAAKKAGTKRETDPKTRLTEANKAPNKGTFGEVVNYKDDPTSKLVMYGSRRMKLIMGDLTSLCSMVKMVAKRYLCCMQSLRRHRRHRRILAAVL